MSAGADSLKSILFALGANFLIAVAKTAGAVFTGSSSMLAEAIHSYADCANQALLLWGLREGRRRPIARPSARLRQGDLLLELHRRADAVQHGRPVLDLRRHAQAAARRQPVENAWVAIAILVFAIAAESVSLWGCLREVNKERGAQGAVALVPQLAPERAARRLRRRHRRARRPDAGAGLHRPGARHRQSGLGRRRLDLHRRAAGGRGRAGRRRDQGASHRPERRAARARADARPPRRPARGRDGLQPAHAADGPRRDGRGEGEDAAGRLGDARSSRRSTASSASFRAAFPQVRWLFFEPDVAD